MNDEIRWLLAEAAARKLIERVGSEDYAYWTGYIDALKAVLNPK